jgi:exosome complex RNA-binding protein Rrp4
MTHTYTLFKQGDVVYCRVVSTAHDTDTELACTVESGPKKEWSTGETVRTGDIRHKT